MDKYLVNTCNDCHIVIRKWKHYCTDCLRERRRFYQRRWRRANPQYYVHHYDPEYSKRWYAKQRKLKKLLLDDMIKHPRKYLDRVKL